MGSDFGTVTHALNRVVSRAQLEEHETILDDEFPHVSGRISVSGAVHEVLRRVRSHLELREKEHLAEQLSEQRRWAELVDELKTSLSLLREKRAQRSQNTVRTRMETRKRVLLAPQRKTATLHVVPDLRTGTPSAAWPVDWHVCRGNHSVGSTHSGSRGTPVKNICE